MCPKASIVFLGSPYQDLVKEVLYELLFQRPRCQETMQVGPKEFGYKIAVASSAIAERVRNRLPHMSSRGEMNMSLRLMTL